MTDPLNPSSNWISANVDLNRGEAKLFKNQNGQVWSASRALTGDEKHAKQQDIRIEVIRGGRFNYYLNGSLVGSYGPA